MSDVKLTHKQAFQIRCIAVVDAYDYEFSFDVCKLVEASLIAFHGRMPYLTSIGGEALAAYDAEWVMVRREDLESAMIVVNNELGGLPWIDRLNDVLEAKC